MLSVNHEKFLENLIEAMLEPVSLIKCHLGNQEANESSHRKFLEMALQEK